MSVEFDQENFRRAVLDIVETDHLFHLLKDVIDARRAAGVPDEALIAVLSRLRLDLQDEGREEDEEFVANGLDEITGW
ncbi:hypothetical protein AB0I60_03185 [Actinosynnema sp. NPDC050436]|uniref:hypothetical protein n=1 Tax=Actinosynnema sp. NPDC050436 TaxID=3155659 RepID=UPI0033EBEEC6